MPGGIHDTPSIAISLLLCYCLTGVLYAVATITMHSISVWFYFLLIDNGLCYFHAYAMPRLCALLVKFKTGNR